MAKVVFAECVPQNPAVKLTDYYEHNWLYVYRYQGNQSKIDKMVKSAKEMAKNGSKYRYVNPGFGPTDWCCVTACSYWVYEAGITGTKWKMGDRNQPYFWSPRYGGDTYDDFLINNNFKKLLFKDVKKDGLRAGDILQSNDHSVTVVEGCEVDDMTYAQGQILKAFADDVVVTRTNAKEYPHVTKFVRAFLYDAGYVTVISTKWTKKLTKKLKKWQKDNKLPETGAFDKLTNERMQKG